MPRARKVAVIGGGWAGLAAAVELCDAGVEVMLFEAGRELGGRARSVEVAGRRLDNGQHLLIGAYVDTLRLMRKVGADPERLLERRCLELDYPGAGFSLRLPALPAPLNLVAGLIAARGCRLAEKAAAARFMRALEKADYRLAADCSVSALLDRHDQRGVVRRLLWEALCLAALNTPPGEASAQLFVNVLRDSLGGQRAGTDFLLTGETLGSLFPQPAADFIAARGGTLRLSTRIGAIDPGLSVAGSAYDDVVLATAPQHAHALLASIPATAATAAQIAAYRYEPIATAYLAYAPELRLPRPMLGLAQATPGGHGQWVVERRSAHADESLLAFVLSARGPWQALDNAALVAALHGELEAALGRTLAPSHWHFVVREKKATFACAPGLPRPTARTALPGLWLAGDYVCADYPATIEGAVRSGVAAADAILGRAT